MAAKAETNWLGIFGVVAAAIVTLWKGAGG